MKELQNLGWNAELAAAFEEQQREGCQPARISAQEREGYRLITACGEYPATMSGRMHHEAHHTENVPAVGDWAVASVHPESGFARIHSLLPRRTALRRKLSAERVIAPQVVAANIDTVFIATSANRDFNPRRIERLLTLVWESRARPVLLLTKVDLVDDPEPYLERARAIAWGTPVHAVSAHAGLGLEVLNDYLEAGATIVLLGTSGVGKSTLTNHLVGESRMYVNAVRADDDRGRHTTTARHLLSLPGGGAIIDTPGLRAVSLWAADEGLQTTFGDIEELAGACRFGDCAHQGEPGCAVEAAVADGQLEADRLAAYFKLQRELQHLDNKRSQQSASASKRRWKAQSKLIRRSQKTQKRQWEQ